MSPLWQVQGDDQGSHPGQRLHEEPGAVSDPWGGGLHVPCGLWEGRLHHRGGGRWLSGLRDGRWARVWWFVLRFRSFQLEGSLGLFCWSYSSGFVLTVYFCHFHSWPCFAVFSRIWGLEHRDVCSDCFSSQKATLALLRWLVRSRTSGETSRDRSPALNFVTFPAAAQVARSSARPLAAAAKCCATCQNALGLLNAHLLCPPQGKCLTSAGEDGWW